MDVEEVSLDLQLEQAPKRMLIETEAGRILFERSGVGNKKDGERTTKVVAFLRDGRRNEISGMPLSQQLRQAIAAVSSSRPLRAFVIEQGTIVQQTDGFRLFLQTLPGVIGVVMALIGSIGVSLGLIRFLFIGLGMALCVIVLDAWKKQPTYRRWVIDRGKRLGTRTVDQYELPGAAEEIEIDDVKEEYGALISDIVYRIENPALFDPMEPTSKAFTLALLQWDNNDGMIPDDERRELAIKVRSTFEAAKANAERLGISYIPARSRQRAQTALKSARLANDTSATTAEREAALERAVTILDEIALYFLPSGAQARKAITGKAPLQLPGRRS